MFYTIRKLYHPEFYQGPNRSAAYFEGWYYKTTIDGRAFALIPGVSRAAEDPHAFVQFIDGRQGESSYHSFPLAAFSYRRDRFEISIGGNRFGLDGYSVSLPEIECDLRIDGPHGWPSTLVSPGAMGWYSFVPFMECRHGIIVMDGEVSGTLNGTRIGNGRVYVEKDFGKSFPNAWIWFQTNSFSRPACSVTCSVANVPFVGGAFTGFIAAVLVDGTLHRFATYTGARISSIDVGDAEVAVTLEDSSRVLVMRARREEGAQLAAPARGAMVGRIVESLRSSVEVSLSVDGVEVFHDTGAHAGLEVVAPEALYSGSVNRSRS